MEWIDVALLLALGAVAVLIVRYLHRTKKSGRKCVGCPGGCGNCSGCSEKK